MASLTTPAPGGLSTKPDFEDMPVKDETGKTAMAEPTQKLLT